MTQGRRRRGGWAALCSPPPPSRRAPLLRGRAAAHKERREQRESVQVCTRAPWPCSECPPAGLQPWDKPHRRQHQLKRCEGEVVALQLKMQRCTSFLFLSLILCATLSETFGLLFSAKEKRGWTLNSAGYLLGPHAVDNHRSFNDKHGFTGKREIQPDEDIKAGNLGRPLAYENIVHTVIEFLTYLHLKEVGALDKLSSAEETNQS
ncbi:galanin peptides isoform X2 [Mycteria americana]|uniref:galanin peptides isoform X2 n=1 Tax=Mycteria americana TaxID=33587 RepID=UPI003F58AA05